VGGRRRGRGGNEVDEKGGEEGGGGEFRSTSGLEKSIMIHGSAKRTKWTRGEWWGSTN